MGECYAFYTDALSGMHGVSNASVAELRGEVAEESGTGLRCITCKKYLPLDYYDASAIHHKKRDKTHTCNVYKSVQQCEKSKNRKVASGFRDLKRYFNDAQNIAFEICSSKGGDARGGTYRTRGKQATCTKKVSGGSAAKCVQYAWWGEVCSMSAAACATKQSASCFETNVRPGY